jgi:hypothetical protein
MSNNIKSYCINLFNQEYKYRKSLNELSKIGLNPIRFKVPKHKIKKRILREGVNEKSNQILESHLSLLRHILSVDGDYFILFEDDIEVIREISVEEIILSAPNGWDIIYLGGMNHHHNPVIIDENFYKCIFSFNAHAYIIKKEFIPKIISQLEEKEFEFDVILAYMQSKGIGNWYGLIDDAIIQNGIESPTFINCSEQSYNKLNKIIKKKQNLKFIEYRNFDENDFYDVCNGLTPFIKYRKNIVDKNSNRCSLFIETRNLPNLEFTIRNTLNKLGDGWFHIIYCSSLNFELVKNVCNDISTEIEINIIDHIDRNQYNNLLLSLDFWEKIKYEHIFIYQSDTIIFENFNNEFLKYDYIGGLWNDLVHLEFIKEKLGIDYYIYNGNGGLSIRKKSFIKKCLENEENNNLKINNKLDDSLEKIPEDVFYSVLLNNDYLNISKYFSSECEYSVESMGLHKPWNLKNILDIGATIKNRILKKYKKRILFVIHEESLTGSPLLMKHLVSYEITKKELDVWCLFLRKSNDNWDIENKIYYSEIPGKNDFEKCKYIESYLNIDIVYVSSIVSLNFCSNFICKKIISIQENRSLNGFIDDLPKLKKYDSVIVGCESTYNLLKGMEVYSKIIPYYISKDNICYSSYMIKKDLIVGAGFVQLRKGIHRFIDIANKIPNKKFIWIGEYEKNITNNVVCLKGPEYLLYGDNKEIVTIYKDIPENVNFIGLKSPNEVYDIISSSECFLMLSTDDTFPLVTIDAKLSNTKVINLKESGDSYKICDNNDLVLEKYDIKEIVEYINNITPYEKKFDSKLYEWFLSNVEVNRTEYL